MAAKKKWRGRATYEQLLQQRERESLTFPELSKRSGVPVGSLQRWDRRLRREKASAAPFVEVVPAAEATSAGRIEVLLRSGHVLYLEPGPPSAGLAELVNLLEAC